MFRIAVVVLLALAMPGLARAWCEDSGKLSRLHKLVCDTRDRRERRAAVFALTELGDKAVKALRRDLKHRDAGVRRDVVFALGEIGIPAFRAVPEMAALLGDKEVSVRAAAARALRRMGNWAADAVPQLMKALAREPDRTARVAMAEALGGLGANSEPAVPALVRACRDRHAVVRHAAAKALGAIGPRAEPAVGALGRMLGGDPSRDVRRQAALALGSIAGRWRMSHGVRVVRIVAPLTRALKDKKYAVRLAAVEALGQIGPRAHSAAPALVRVLMGAKARMRRTAAKALGNLGGQAAPAAVPALRNLLNHRDVKTRVVAARALGDIGPRAEPAAAQLKHLVSSRNRELMRAAVEALFEIDPTIKIQPPTPAARLARISGVTALKTLDYATRTPDREIQRAAFEGLVRLGDEAVPVLVRALDNKQILDEAVEALGHIGPAAVKALTKAVTKPKSPGALAGAIRALGAIGRRAAPALPALQPLHKDKRLPVRRALVFALGELGQSRPAVIALLARASLDKDIELRRIAARALGAIGTAAAVRPLARLAADKNEMTRDLAVRALGQCGKPALPALGRALRDKSAGIRQTAVSSIARLGPRGVGLLVRALRDRDTRVRSNAALLLGELGPGGVPGLARALDDPSGEVVFNAARALGEIGPRALPVLERRLKHKDPIVRRAAAYAIEAMGAKAAASVPALTRALKDPDMLVRMNAAEALGNIGTAAGPMVPSLLSLLKDRSLFIRRQIYRVLGRVGRGNPRAMAALLGHKNPRLRTAAVEAVSGDRRKPTPAALIPRLLERLAKDGSPGVRREAARALGFAASHRPKCVHALSVALGDKDVDVRAAAATALGNMETGAATALYVLVKALRDHDEHVRRAAAETLGRIGPKATMAIKPLAAAMQPPASKEQVIAAATALGAIGRPQNVALTALTRLLDRKIKVLRGIAVHPVDSTSKFHARNNVWPLAEAAARALKKLKQGKRALARLKPLLKRGPWVDRTRAALVMVRLGHHAAVDYLRDALQDTPSRTRLLAVDALRELGPLAASATPELKQASRDGSRKVRKAANKALAALEARPRPGDRR